jgi:phosphohistidine phosphatase
MKIWVMRHGEASFNAPSDSLRNLTPNGVNQAFEQGKRLGADLLANEIYLDKVLVSPYVRAQQTTQQLEKGLQAAGFQQNFANLMEQWEAITPSGDVDTVIDYLSFLGEEGAQNVLIVSHLPLVFDLVQALTQFQAAVHFYPAVIAEVEWAKQRGQLTKQF